MKDVSKAAMFFVFAMTFAIGMGYLINASEQREHDLSVECIRSGKALMECSCVAVKP